MTTMHMKTATSRSGWSPFWQEREGPRAVRMIASRPHQRAWALEIVLHDCACAPIGKRPDSAGRVVAAVVREDRGAHDEQIVGVPGLQIAVDRAGLGVGAHDGAAGVVHGLRSAAVEVAAARVGGTDV